MSPTLIFLVCFLHFLVASESFTRTISTGREKVTVNFTLFPIRSSNFDVLVQNAAGQFTSYAAPAERTYLGTVIGYPGAMASGLLKPSGVLLCRISFESGVEWSSTGSGLASVRGSTTGWKPQLPTTTVTRTKDDNVIYVAEVGVDASYLEYQAVGSALQDTLDMVEFSIMAANIPFIRDASILHKIGKVVIRTSQYRDPYNGSGGDTNKLLYEVQRQWNNVITSVVGSTQDLALVVQPGAGGGLAFVGVVSTPSAYSANGADPNGDFSVIWRHEAGHNWGSDHYEGGGRPEGPTIMSDNELSRFSSSELAKILDHKATLPQLASSMSIPRPPRVNMDTGIITGLSYLTLDVLTNDLDADLRSLKIISVQNPSALNGGVYLMNQRVVYTAASVGPSTVDYFTYTIENAVGRTATGYVIIKY